MKYVLGLFFAIVFAASAAAQSLTLTGAGTGASGTPLPSSYSFTMTAGDYATVIQGYNIDDSSGLPVMGSIDAEPIPGHVLGVLYTSSSQQGMIVFVGDVTALVSGKTVWVDGVEYPFDSSGWQSTGGDGGSITAAPWNTAGPVFVGGVSYFIEIK